MAEFGLTGGIGSGKSSAADRLVDLGAGLVDADATVKSLQRAGQPVFVAMVEHFGTEIVAPDGELDRAKVASIVFNDKEQLSRLNEIVHPAVWESMQEQRKRLRNNHRVVILDIPLLVEGGNDYGELAGLIVVDLPPEAAVSRLIEHRGFSEQDARSRIANQVSRQDRVGRADFVIDNRGDLEDLDAEVQRCWQWIEQTCERVEAQAKSEPTAQAGTTPEAADSDLLS